MSEVTIIFVPLSILLLLIPAPILEIILMLKAAQMFTRGEECMEEKHKLWRLQKSILEVLIFLIILDSILVVILFANPPPDGKSTKGFLSENR